MLWFILLAIATGAIIKWMTSDDEDEPEVEEYRYNRETELIHYPDGSVEIRRRED